MHFATVFGNNFCVKVFPHKLHGTAIFWLQVLLLWLKKKWSTVVRIVSYSPTDLWWGREAVLLLYDYKYKMGTTGTGWAIFLQFLNVWLKRQLLIITITINKKSNIKNNNNDDNKNNNNNINDNNVLQGMNYVFIHDNWFSVFDQWKCFTGSICQKSGVSSKCVGTVRGCLKSCEGCALWLSNHPMNHCCNTKTRRQVYKKSWTFLQVEIFSWVLLGN